jgi:hypothetical protein
MRRVENVRAKDDTIRCERDRESRVRESVREGPIRYEPYEQDEEGSVLVKI